MKKFSPILLFVIYLGAIIIGSFFSLDFLYLLYLCPLVILFFCVGFQDMDNAWKVRDKKPKGKNQRLHFLIL